MADTVYGYDCGSIPDELTRPLLLALDQTPIAVSLVDPGGTITWVNAAFSRFTGYSAAEAVGAPITMLGSPAHDTASYEVVRDALRAGDPWSGRVTIVCHGGSTCRARATATPVRGGDGLPLGYCIFAQDTSEEVKLEAQLAQLQKMEAIGELAAGIAHEINTPIQYVGDNIQFLRDGITGVLQLVEAMESVCEASRRGPASTGDLEAIDRIRDEIDLAFLKEELLPAIDQAMEGRDRVADIVRAMKEFAHPGDEERVPIDVNHAIENTLAVSRGEWKHVACIERELDPCLPAVPCYPGSFNQVLLNLVVNAAHAIAEARGSGAAAKGTIRVSTRTAGRTVEIGIADTGCGIPEGSLRRIFEPFYTTKDVGKGTGQGLALAHAVIVERMQGRIEVDSTPGQGTQFTLHLPLEDPGHTGAPEA